MTYAEQIRHPNGALDPREQDEGQSGGRWFWILLGVAALTYFAWRMGWLDKMFKAMGAGMSAVKPIANPHGWV